MFKAHGGSHSFYFKQVKDFYLLDLIYISQFKTTPTRTTYIYINIFIFTGEIPIPTPPLSPNQHKKRSKEYPCKACENLLKRGCKNYI